MKNSIIILLFTLGMGLSYFSCESGAPADGTPAQHVSSQKIHSSNLSESSLFLTDYKFDNLNIKVDTMQLRAISGIIRASGELVVSPQHQAAVTPVMGGNVEEIRVIEGDKVIKGQVLAYLTHPDFTRLQSDYLRSFAQLEFLQQEFDRQQRLYEEEVGAGRSLQKTKSELHILQVELKGYEAQLRQLHLDPEKIRETEIYERIPVLSPISGYVEKIQIHTGQFVQPESSMISVINIDHLHADLMVFEKDIARLTEGQSVSLALESNPGHELKGKIYSIGKVFEKNMKAVHVHASIEKTNHPLLPGMYVQGKIFTSEEQIQALPEGAVIEEEGRSYIFLAQKSENSNPPGWIFEPIEIHKGITADDWVEILIPEPLTPGTSVVWDGAYYLIAEMKKGELEDD